jgi:hypothetical protein
MLNPEIPKNVIAATANPSAANRNRIRTTRGTSRRVGTEIGQRGQ